MDELVERLEQDMAMVADRDATTRQAGATVVEAALETLYDGKPVPREVAGVGAWKGKLDELVRRIEAHETAHAAAVESLMDTQERLVAQVGSFGGPCWTSGPEARACGPAPRWRPLRNFS
ncbi:MAG: hypothetical protein CM1200mP2_23680 [Planctomycetaceae bacterium]|nr:MAG: hypothetical protein CM1200mP2_23680 [Planctomycetaceae bacterium]